MKKIIRKGITVLSGMLVGSILLLTGGVKAAENMDTQTEREPAKQELVEEWKLPVRITRGDGIEITPKDREMIDTCLPLFFSADTKVGDELFIHKRGVDAAYEDEDSLIRAKTELQYAVSRDNGATFGEWTKIIGGAFFLDPGTYPDGEYCIKLRKLQEYVLNEDKAETLRIAEKISQSCISDDPEPVTENEITAEEGQSEEEPSTEKPSTGEPPEEEAGTEETVTGTISDNKTTAEEEKEPDEKNENADTRPEDESENDERPEDKQAADDENNGDDEKENGGAVRPDAEERIRRAEELAFSEGIHIIESGEYYVNLDASAPVLFLDVNVAEGEWTNKGVKGTVMINDTGSGPEWIRITCDDSRIAEENFSRDTGLSGTQKEFFINEESVSAEGGELVIEAADRAGNRARISRRIGIDKTAPEITLKGAEEGKVYNKPVTVSVAGEDISPSTVCVGYTVKRVISGAEETVECSARTLAECNEGALFAADTDGDYIIECHARDRAGNTSKTLRRSFRLDSTPPGLKLEGIGNKALIRNDAALKVTACDNYADGYKVSLKGTVRSSESSRELKLADFKTDGLISSNTYYFKVDGDYELNVEASDSAGNICKESIEFSIDKEPPEITLLDGGSLSDGLVTNEPPNIRFRVKESNYRTALVSYELKPAGKNRLRDNVKDVKSFEWFMSNESDEYSVLADEEGSYELIINAVDGAGNSSAKTISFTLDMTSPSIDYVENLNKKYIKSFKLPDNFNEYIKDQGEVSYQTYINSRNYDANEQIEEDGKYVLKVSAVDDAGNQTEKTVEFIVDGTLPRVVIDGMADDGSVNKDGVIVLSLYDEGDYFRSVRLNGEEMITGSSRETVSIPIPDYGDYKIEVEAVDMADNILTQTIEAKCANASPVEKGVSTVRTLKRSDNSGNDKGLRIFLIVMTVLVLAGSIVVYTLYNMKTREN